MIGSRIITMEFDNTRFWKFTTALGRKLSDGRLFFTKLFLTVWGRREGEREGMPKGRRRGKGSREMGRGRKEEGKERRGGGGDRTGWPN